MIFIFLPGSPIIIISRSTHVAANDIISFLFMAELYISLHSFIDGYLSCFLVFTNVNSAAMNALNIGFIQIQAHRWDSRIIR